ncbi:Uncharacterized protein Fot_51863 [Forsythia ovata]|uniref:Uncharacterized protein n=1 Tax=Forsythia ovata TaxID=205694 RepID=A0ABD1PY99_9LAMI
MINLVIQDRGHQQIRNPKPHMLAVPILLKIYRYHTYRLSATNGPWCYMPCKELNKTKIQLRSPHPREYEFEAQNYASKLTDSASLRCAQSHVVPHLSRYSCPPNTLLLISFILVLYK